MTPSSFPWYQTWLLRHDYRHCGKICTLYGDATDSHLTCLVVLFLSKLRRHGLAYYLMWEAWVEIVVFDVRFSSLDMVGRVSKHT